MRSAFRYPCRGCDRTELQRPSQIKRPTSGKKAGSGAPSEEAKSTALRPNPETSGIGTLPSSSLGLRGGPMGPPRHELDKKVLHSVLCCYRDGSPGARGRVPASKRGV